MMLLRVLIVMGMLASPAAGCEVPADLSGLRAGMLALANAQRADARLVILRPEARLDAAAQAQACRMAERERLSHRGSWFAGLGRRLRREGYAYAMAVENIGEGQGSAVEIISGWMDSPPHRQNLLADAAREAGFGVARAANGRLHWSMVAAAPAR